MEVIEVEFRETIQRIVVILYLLETNVPPNTHTHRHTWTHVDTLHLKVFYAHLTERKPGRP